MNRRLRPLAPLPAAPALARLTAAVSAPALVASLIGVAIVGDTGLAIWRITRPTVTASVVTKRPPLPAAMLPGVGSLFGIPLHAESAAAPPSALVLHGTLAVPDPTAGLAIIQVAGTATVFRVGFDVAGRTLREVYTDHVMLERDGILETLVLPHASTAFIVAGNAEPRAPTLAATADTPPEPPPPSADELAHRVATATAPLASVLTARPLLDGGQYRALVVEPAGNNASFDRLGFKPGDAILAVNDLQVNENTLGLLAQYVASGKPVRVYLNRQGTGPIEVPLNTAVLGVAAVE